MGDWRGEAAGGGVSAPAGPPRAEPLLGDGERRRALALAQAEAGPDGLLIVSPLGEILSTNRRFAEIWGFPQSVIDARDDDLALAHALERVADPEGFIRRVREVYANPSGRSHDEIALRDGRVVDRYGSPLHDEQGRYIGYAWWFRDVTAQKRAEAQLRELAETLQASLLPPRPPAIPGMEVAARHRAGSPGLSVGGDFYDVFRLRPNDWGVVIGDVCGKGARAAALTALARYSVRSAAVHQERPSDVLRELNSALVADPDLDERFCALVVARLEQDWCGAWVTLACAGHPLPLVLRRSGWVDVRGQAGGLVGLFEHIEVSDDRVGLGPGDALVLCTDGITEARGVRGEQFGEDRLPMLLARLADADAEHIADAVVEAAQAFSAGPIIDDAAVLVLRVPADAGQDPESRLRLATGDAMPVRGRSCEQVGPAGPRVAAPREARFPLAADASSAPAARRFLAAVLRSWRMPELLGGDLELVLAELVANALRHTAAPHVVIVRYDGARLRLEVGDSSRAMPRVGEAGQDATGGRGLGIVTALASGWGVVPTVQGKRVWAEVPVPPAAQSDH